MYVSKDIWMQKKILNTIQHIENYKTKFKVVKLIGIYIGLNKI